MSQHLEQTGHIIASRSYDIVPSMIHVDIYIHAKAYIRLYTTMYWNHV